MNKVDWIRKLTSRKFWIALVSFISALLVAFKVDEGSIEQISAIIMSFASLIAYIVAEGLVDATNKEGKDNGES